MAIAFQDTFSTPGATMPSGWTEVNDGGSILTNMSVANGVAQIDVNTVNLAVVDGSSEANHIFQCWLRVPDSSNNSGLVYRYIDSDDFYYFVIDPTNGFQLFKRDTGSFVGPLASDVGGITQNTWHRVSVKITGDLHEFYLEGDYDDINEGPKLRHTDTSFTGQSGQVGIISSGNVATGASGPLWDNFQWFDTTPITVYFDVAASTPSLGTQASPDPDFGYAINSAGLVRKGKIKCLTQGSTPIGNAGSNNWSIGHAGKFVGSGSFPEYSDGTGQVISAGSPNLIIEGTDDVIRTLFRETQNRAYFTLRADASYILFRGFDFDMTGGIGSQLVNTISTNNVGASTEHSVAVDKCKIELGTASVSGQSGITIGTDADVVRMRYCEGSVRSGRTGAQWILLASVVDVQVRMNVFHGSVSRGILLGGTLSVGGLLDVDHNHFVDLNRVGQTVSCLELTFGGYVAGDVVFQNNLAASRGASPVEFGTRITANPELVTGSVEAHHNGYFGIVTPRGTGVTDGGNEVDSTDPLFVSELTTYDWTQTRQSPSIVLPSDWRPLDPAYVNTADDMFMGEFLDRGALQTFAAGSMGLSLNLLGGDMARTIDALARLVMKEDEQAVVTAKTEILGTTITSFYEGVVTLSTNTTNVQIPFGANFNTVVFGLLVGENGTFQFSRSGMSAKQFVDSGGFVVWKGATTSLYLSNFATTTPGTEPTVKIVLGGD